MAELERIHEQETDEQTLYSQYREALVGLILSINQQIPLTKNSQYLLLHKLDSIEKIRAFRDWVKERLEGETLHATEVEICRAAVQISKQ